MAISSHETLENLLKVYYKDGVENLLFANSPLLMKIKKNRFEGKKYNFSAIAGGNFCTGADYTEAVEDANKVGEFVEFSVDAGQLFSVYGVTAKELASATTLKGAYMKPAGAKMFCATEGLRKANATALYGRGFGEIGTYTASAETYAVNEAVEVTFADMSSVMKLDLGSKVDVKISVETAPIGVMQVTSINGKTVTFKVLKNNIAFGDATYVISLHGFGLTTANGYESIAPVGLGGWLPTVAERTGVNWTNYINKSFFNVARINAPDRLAGQFYKATSGEKHSVALQKLLMQCRRAGSKADFIVLNDEDWYTISADINTTSSYMAKVGEGSGKRKASLGLTDISVGFASSWIEDIIPDPYCPKGQFYILDSDAIEFVSYTNTKKVEDSTSVDAGKPDPMSSDNADVSNEPARLMIDDMLNIKPGDDTAFGPATRVSLMEYGNFVIYNPSVCGTGLFDGATPITVVA